jgi:hypothetical protein
VENSVAEPLWQIHPEVTGTVRAIGQERLNAACANNDSPPMAVYICHVPVGAGPGRPVTLSTLQ